jgi:hypothetical protein
MVISELDGRGGSPFALHAPANNDIPVGEKQEIVLHPPTHGQNGKKGKEQDVFGGA